MTKTISLRTEDGWATFKHNQSKTHCDWDGAKLFIAPHNGIYCDKVHEITENAVNTGDDCPRCGMPNTMYWCSKCEDVSETDKCRAGHTLKVDKIYHKECS